MFSLWRVQYHLGDRIHGTFWAAKSGRLGATATTRSRSSPGPGGATSDAIGSPVASLDDSWMLACILTSSSEGRSSKQTAAKHSSAGAG